MELHTYKVCQVVPRDPEQKMGRPRRDVLMVWENLSDEEVLHLREVQEPRLKAGQIAELDNKIVARGPEENVAPQAASDADGVGDDDSEDLAALGSDDPLVVTRHATRMLWDVYRRHAAASAELREQTNEMNKRAIAQARQLDEALSAIQTRQPSAPISINVKDVEDMLRAGAGLVREFMGGERDPGPEE